MAKPTKTLTVTTAMPMIASTGSWGLERGQLEHELEGSGGRHHGEDATVLVDDPARQGHLEGQGGIRPLLREPHPGRGHRPSDAGEGHTGDVLALQHARDLGRPDGDRARVARGLALLHQGGEERVQHESELTRVSRHTRQRRIERGGHPAARPRARAERTERLDQEVVQAHELPGGRLIGPGEADPHDLDEVGEDTRGEVGLGLDDVESGAHVGQLAAIEGGAASLHGAGEGLRQPAIIVAATHRVRLVRRRVDESQELSGGRLCRARHLAVAVALVKCAIGSH